ncbi:MULTISPECIES: hypothetical protein [Pseudanabaena]|uniref:Uncharacterized protein n=2 Tax=Pseudanabaena TaxID=1152 RepID=L8N2V7_9CYAN|nr:MULTISPECIES: hypothetical protein [Pseudanabaena]ELS33394.1 hypothetical protein Pse7429DRAFT_1732 [Pseudanabaena biceps PCC 7429]MDG3494376.1 hypothetical protein [Pseudanabaena catenata USMAC16]
MSLLNLEYITNQEGQPTAVVIPIEIWRQLFPIDNISLENLSEAIEDYCLNKAMDEGKNTPLYSRAEALAFLED